VIPSRKFIRRLAVTDDGERAAFRWLQKIGAIPAHHKPEPSNIRLGIYSKQKDSIQEEGNTKGHHFRDAFWCEYTRPCLLVLLNKSKGIILAINSYWSKKNYLFSNLSYNLN